MDKKPDTKAHLLDKLQTICWACIDSGGGGCLYERGRGLSDCATYTPVFDAEDKGKAAHSHWQVRVDIGQSKYILTHIYLIFSRMEKETCEAHVRCDWENGAGWTF